MQDSDLLHIYDVSLFNISDLDVLLHETLKHLRELLSAQAGTIYIKEGNYLKFHVFQNDGMSYENIYRHYHNFKDLKLPINDEHKYLAVDVFSTKKIIVIDNVYESNLYGFEGVKEFDQKFDYKTVSIITIPLIHPITNECLGVIQILNKCVNGEILPFDEKDKEIISILSSFMAISISKAQNNLDKLNRVNEELKETNLNVEKKIEEEIINNQQKSAVIFHKSKISSMGEMLSNIAHQWRQPLSVISTIASGLSLELQLDKVSKTEAMNQLRKIVVTTQNLSQTIDEFRSFYNLESKNENFNVKQAIDKTLELAEVILWHNKIEVFVDVDKNIEIFGLKNEFTQAFLNIITTLKDSLISTKNSDKRFIFINMFTQDGRKILKIYDNCNHESDSNENHKKQINIFNMGLYMTKLIIQNHFNGDIEFNNINFQYNGKNYKGEEYTIILP